VKTTGKYKQKKKSTIALNSVVKSFVFKTDAISSKRNFVPDTAMLSADNDQ